MKDSFGAWTRACSMALASRAMTRLIGSLSLRLRPRVTLALQGAVHEHSGALSRGQPRGAHSGTEGGVRLDRVHARRRRADAVSRACRESSARIADPGAGRVLP